ncbi:patatin-like phospholipase family protein [Sphingobacterium chuzhouense]|uniref:Patatin-like phospholipase family protein n=1 Tax=Sphingobacterium chuzhouense TaxID=1742264 RepID=A0ABR7XQ57_9SPHI|nr:patatin-like phospholipase family protein [Sphingobacterium chuzhouense]MBD1421306.1 patatin-like phospholipase family protein [Sphingobacterium chuzhouense]
MILKRRKKVSLVLGGGGARGITHIGVIQWLEEQGYEIDEIVGCSIGALVGGAYATNRLQELADWMKTLTRAQVFKLMDFSNPRYGLLKGERVLNTLHEVFDDVNIEDLALTYTAVATDLENEQEVVFREGSIYAAIRASIAIPGVFTGVSVENRFLVDGGVLNPLPLNHVSRKRNLVVAVNLDGMPIKDKSTTPPHFTARTLLMESYYAMRRRLSALMLELHEPDYTICVPHNAAEIWEFHRSAELIDVGYELARTVIKSHS